MKFPTIVLFFEYIKIPSCIHLNLSLLHVERSFTSLRTTILVSFFLKKLNLRATRKLNSLRRKDYKSPTESFEYTTKRWIVNQRICIENSTNLLLRYTSVYSLKEATVSSSETTLQLYV